MQEIYFLFLRFLFVILLLFGAKKIPELARGMGRGIREFKDATKDIKNEIEDSMNEETPPAKSKPASSRRT